MYLLVVVAVSAIQIGMLILVAAHWSEALLVWAVLNALGCGLGIQRHYRQQVKSIGRKCKSKIEDILNRALRR